MKRIPAWFWHWLYTTGVHLVLCIDEHRKSHLLDIRQIVNLATHPGFQTKLVGCRTRSVAQFIRIRSITDFIIIVSKRRRACRPRLHSFVLSLASSLGHEFGRVGVRPIYTDCWPADCAAETAQRGPCAALSAVSLAGPHKGKLICTLACRLCRRDRLEGFLWSSSGLRTYWEAQPPVGAPLHRLYLSVRLFLLPGTNRCPFQFERPTCTSFST